MSDRTEFEAIARSSIAAALAFDPSLTGQVALVPDGFTVEGLEAYQIAPNRRRAHESFVDIGSLAEYVNTFAEPGTMIGADYAKATITATIDGHTKAAAGHREHKATFTAQQHETLRAWLAICKRPMSQVEFGLFLEDRAIDVVTPDPASVMEMVMTFDATKKVTFKSAQRLHDGQRQFQYVEQNEVKGGVTLPDNFVILAPVYRGMEPQRIKFMVRYRIEDGALRFTVDMHDRDAVLRDAFQRCVDGLKVGLKSPLPIYVIG